MSPISLTPEQSVEVTKSVSSNQKLLKHLHACHCPITRGILIQQVLWAQDPTFLTGAHCTAEHILRSKG